MRRLYHTLTGHWALGLLIGMTLTSCAEKPASDEMEPGAPLCLSVEGIGDLPEGTRSMLVGPDRVTQLEQACTGNFKGRVPNTREPSTAPQCVRISASYQKHGETSLTGLFHQNELIFDKKDNTYATQWNYAGPEKEWVRGANYQFRAYFPGKSERAGGLPGLQQIAGEDATQIVLKYWTQNLQEDLLVASASGGNPVALDFHHALSAVRFKFRFADDVVDDDNLTSCRLQNMAGPDELVKRTGCFGHIGSMVYGNGDILASKQDREYQKWHVNWCEEYSYEWRHMGGVRFSRSADGTVQEAVAYNGDVVDLYAGQQFVDNEGWIYVIPQTVTKGLQLCFTTRDNTVREFQVPLISRTGGQPGEPLVFEAGQRYTYTFTFSLTQLDLTLDIEPWEEIDLPLDIEWE